MDHMLIYIENLMGDQKKKKNTTRTSEFIKATECMNDKREKRLYFYMLTMNNQKLNLQKQYHGQMADKKKNMYFMGGKHHC